MLDEAIHTSLRCLISDEIIWRKTSVPWIRYYYAEDTLYVLRDMRHTWPSFAFVYAHCVDAAVDFMLSQGGWKQTIQLVEKGGKA